MGYEPVDLQRKGYMPAPDVLWSTADNSGSGLSIETRRSVSVPGWQNYDKITIVLGVQSQGTKQSIDVYKRDLPSLPFATSVTIYLDRFSSSGNGVILGGASSGNARTRDDSIFIGSTMSSRTHLHTIYGWKY